TSRRMVLRCQARSAVWPHVWASIGGVDHALRIGWINPQAVVVAVRRVQVGKRLSAVGGAVHVGVEDVNRFRTLGVSKNVSVVPRALAEAAGLVNQGPLLAPLIRTGA